MPRILVKNFDYMESDLKDYIFCEMGRQKITETEMGKTLGISQQVFSYRLRNGKLTTGNLIRIFGKLKTEEQTIIKLMKERER